MNLNKLTPIINKPSGAALMPLVVFLCLYLVTSLIVNDFYKVPITVAFLVASIYAVATTKGLSLNDRIIQYSSGAANKNIMMMIWIFILAGAFAQSAKAMGAIDATVNLTLHLLPGSLLLAGVFLASCFISLSIGTSVGTIVALVPVAVGIASKTDVGIPFMTALVIGGAFFGDNLSFISDTTIAATRTQGCQMRDKFKMNMLIALPAAILVFAYYIFYGNNVEALTSANVIEWGKVIPYIIVLVTAIAGLNVMLVLLLGIISTGIIGMAYGTFDLFGWFGSMGQGITGMGELIIITLMAGGMLELIRFNGGVDYILHKLTKKVNGKRGAEFSIAALVSLANMCTANNTIAIITVGPLAAEIADQYKIDKRRSASILDIFSCVIQGIIPYGAQMLIAAELASVSPLNIIEYLYYPIVLCIFAILSIILRIPKTV
ncbi:Na+/H+ antiporter NhaC family protein [Bacteroides caecigallinarum]|uniref:Na+/H+ antiporter NhaC family protein n=1 Tax=Bacteroides caecigallinarum TaxID=1411144 RepID=UPI00195BACA1|nr:Na+/H+ antiporter NhaC family protein [Bacteroides caecigallinarum]MBM6882511.1 Na+/H+ antiporter NhaC family protein [Bacteroides caecigallinarum]MBM6888934.1 Na+/H+ antiporter NhaC family protein [Bacteroides caecigallinarum]MCF2552069.1 Na+/H+ antiporter NhaC family protein [Bacteroides caecigallinarum]